MDSGKLTGIDQAAPERQLDELPISPRESASGDLSPSANDQRKLGYVRRMWAKARAEVGGWMLWRRPDATAKDLSHGIRLARRCHLLR